MARLSARERSRLPDSAFAYVDSNGQRRLPINDASHVRNALARFDQVDFEDDRTREKARQRLLNAAKRHGIVPVGFITGQLRSAHRQAAAGRLVIELGRVDTSAELEAELRRVLGDPGLELLRWSKAAGSYVGCAGDPVPLPDESSGRTATFLQGGGRPLTVIVHEPDVLESPELTEAVMAAVQTVTGKELLDAEVLAHPARGQPLPEGVVSFLLTDIEGSTALLQRFGAGYAEVLNEVQAVIREAVLQAGGREVEARADEFVAVFERPEAAVTAAVALQRGLARRSWPEGVEVRVRAGISTGDITLSESGYVGMTVHTAARVMAAAHGGQTLVSAQTTAALGGQAPGGVRLRSLGSHELRGVPGDHEIFQVDAVGRPRDFPPLRAT